MDGPASTDDPAPGLSPRLRGWIEAVSGLGSGGQRGGSRLQEVTLSLPGGKGLTVGHRHRPSQISPRVNSVEINQAGTFELCPICLSDDPGHSKHVPNGACRWTVCN